MAKTPKVENESTDPTEKNKTVDLQEYMDQSYRNYAMYVINDRAIPHVGDGLKPVQRRIIYAMGQLGLDFTAKYKKSARTIGDVLGKYHPHGDSACYEAMVLMAQPFSFRYPLVDGQGNWGSQDEPKSFAAMRYTEAKLSRFAPLLLDDMNFSPVDMKGNFDGTLNEPTVLPAKLPFALLNGVNGIAVGIACDILPHNMKEIIDAITLIIDNSKATLDDVLEIVKGPDFPAKSPIITSKADLREIYSTGNGQVRARARYELDGNNIVITDLPFKSSGERVIEQIAALVNNKTITVIDDIQDHSDKHNPIRIVLKLKKSAKDQAEKIMSFLFSKRNVGLEVSFKTNMTMLGLDGRPEVKSLMAILHEWLKFRTNTVRRRTEFQHKKVAHQCHLIEGLLTAFLNLDEVIRIIREEENPKTMLMQKFNLTDIQSQAILDTRLGKLAKLEEMTLKARYDDLMKEKKRLEIILSSDENIRNEIRKEIAEIREKYADDRCAEIISPEEAKIEAIDERDLAPSEPVRVTVSRHGFVRAGKGYTLDPKALNYKSGDAYLDVCDTKSNRDVAILCSEGRVYNVSAAEFPSARSNGDPLSKWLNPPAGSSWKALVDPESFDKWLMIGSEGFGFVAPKEALFTRNKKGKVLINKAGYPRKPQGIKKETHVIVITTLGRFLVFDINELPVIEKGKGVKLASVKKGETIRFTSMMDPDSVIKFYNEKDESLLTLGPDEWSEAVSERAKAPKKLGDTAGLIEKSRYIIIE